MNFDLIPELNNSVIYTIVTTFIFAVAMTFFRWFFPRFKSKVYALANKYLKSIHFRNFEVISHSSMISALMTFLRILKFAAYLFVFYIYLSLVFSYFPQTKHLATDMLSYILNPFQEVFMMFLNYIPRAIYLVIIFFLLNNALKIVKLFFDRVENGTLKIDGFYPDWAPPTYKIVRTLIVIFSFIIAFPHLPGSSSPAFQGVSVFLGLLFSLGSGSAIANMVAGLVLTYMRPFKLGDRVMLGTTFGDVVEKNLLITRIRTIKNVDITVPNSNVLSNHIHNYTTNCDSEGLIVNMTLRLAYSVAWTKVHKLLLDAASRTEHVLTENKPFILQTALDTSFAEYELNVYTRRSDISHIIYSDLRRHVLDCFREANVEVVNPTIFEIRDAPEQVIPKP